MPLKSNNTGKYNKFKNLKTTVHGIKFDSLLEAAYYEYLLTVYPASAIKVQPEFLLQDKFKCNGKMIRKIVYIADFQIGTQVYDTKGQVTEVFKIKAKLFKRLYPELNLVIVKRGNGQWIES